jgi:hypothetical protein
MALLNLGKFTACLSRYKEFCDRTHWTREELPKFYFANLVNRRVHLKTQDPNTVFEICNRIQYKDFYCKPSRTRICGIQFLPNSGSGEFTEVFRPEDALALRDLVFRNWDAEDLDRKTLSFNAFGGWAGTLIPYRFMPVTSNHFRHTIAYLFDEDLKIYLDSAYDFFIHAQTHFFLTKKRLREFSLESLYLNEINEYLRAAYPKCVLKREFDEYDWNWLTQDFHLFVYREILGLDEIGTRRAGISARTQAGQPAEAFDIQGVLDIYVP